MPFDSPASRKDKPSPWQLRGRLVAAKLLQEVLPHHLPLDHFLIGEISRHIHAENMPLLQTEEVRAAVRQQIADYLIGCELLFPTKEPQPEPRPKPNRQLPLHRFDRIQWQRAREAVRMPSDRIEYWLG